MPHPLFSSTGKLSPTTHARLPWHESCLLVLWREWNREQPEPGRDIWAAVESKSAKGRGYRTGCKTAPLQAIIALAGLDL
jgi:hypothetical protein